MPAAHPTFAARPLRRYRLRSCPPQHRCRSREDSARQLDRTLGGCHRPSRSSFSVRSSSTRRGPATRRRTSSSARISRRCTRHCCSVRPPTRGSADHSSLTWWPSFLRVFAGGADPVGTGGLPAHLLLLPRRVLQGVLGRPARMRRRRAAKEIPRRAMVAARHPEHPSVLPVRRDWLHRAFSASTRGRRCGSRSART